MTIVIALPCTDGVVIATDSMGSSGRVAAEIQKARTVGTFPVIWGMSGSAYMIQQAQSAVEKATARTDVGLTPDLIVTKLREVFEESYTVPLVPPGGDERDLQAHACEALVLGWDSRRGAVMVHLPSDLAPIQQQRSFIAIGGGSEFAAAAFETLSHHVQTGPTVKQATLIAYRVVSSVCKVSSWGVGLPVQIAVADADGSRLLTDEELEQVATGVQRWLAVDAENFASQGTFTNLSPAALPRASDDDPGQTAAK